MVFSNFKENKDLKFRVKFVYHYKSFSIFRNRNDLEAQLKRLLIKEPSEPPNGVVQSLSKDDVLEAGSILAVHFRGCPSDNFVRN